MDVESSEPSPRHIAFDVSSTHAFWLARQFLETLYQDQRNALHVRFDDTLDDLSREPVSHLCENCRLCLDASAADEPTQTIDVPNSVRGLQASASTCIVCRFFLRRLSKFSLDRMRRIRVGQHVPKPQLDEKNPMIDLLLEVTWRMERSHLMVYCPDQNAAAARAIWGRTWPVDLSMRSPLLREWLRGCKQHHPRCAKTMLRAVPSRLLRVDECSDTGLVRLQAFDTNSSTFPEYAALSHCWGTKHRPLSTSLDSVDRFATSVPLLELTPTFHDAIAITRSLGLGYLWIDSLCIIQDSIDDWQNESAKMGSIYENATVTIASSSASDSAGGCVLSLNEVPTQHIHAHSHNGAAPYRGALRSAQADPFAVHASPLNKRGWVLQEMVLSRRILHFTDRQIYWQCRELAESEDGTMQETKRQEDDQKGDRLMLAPNATDAQDLPRLWWAWAMDYSRRLFTVPADRLYACAGITQYFNQLSGKDAVVLGLRREQLQKDLLWTLKDRTCAPRLREAGLPSWTWLSRDAALADEDESAQQRLDAVGKIQAIHVMWQGIELASPLRKASIQMAGRLRRMQVEAQLPGVDTPSWNGTHSLCSDAGVLPARVEVTAMFDDGPPELGSTVVCFELLRRVPPETSASQTTSDGRIVMERMLLLRPVEGEGCFERMGVGAVLYDCWATNAGRAEEQSEEQAVAETMFDKARIHAVTLV